MSSELGDKVNASLVEGGLPCISAWKIAKESQISRRHMGTELNGLGIRCYDCQLGSFGTKKATHEELAGKEADPVIAGEIGKSLTDGRLPCPVAFKIADTLKVAPIDVGNTATIQKIKVNKCQLGFFP